MKKTFVGGILDGISIQEKTSVRLEVGRIYRSCAGSDYRVDACESLCDSCGKPSDDLWRRYPEPPFPSECWMAPLDECPRCREEAR